MIGVLLELIIAAILIGLIVWLATQIPFVKPYANIVQVVALCLFIVWVIYLLMGFLGAVPRMPPLR